MCHHAARLLTTVQVKHVCWARIRMQFLGPMGQWQQGVTIACVHPWLAPNNRGAEEAGANGADAALCNMGKVFSPEPSNISVDALVGAHQGDEALVGAQQGDKGGENA